MYSLEPGSKIIILGTDKRAIASYYKYRTEFDVLGMIDTTQKCETNKNGIRIFAPDIINRLNGAVVVICKENDLWSSKWFIDNGFKLFETFIPKTLFDYDYINVHALYSLSDRDKLENNLDRMVGSKQICMLHGNCQMSVILKYLNHNYKFNDEYIVLKYPDFFAMNDNMKEVYNCDVFHKKIDLFISQLVSEQNKFGRDVSTSYLKSKLRSDCKVVTIPNMYMHAYFPQHNRISDQVHRIWGIKSFEWGDKYLDGFCYQRIPYSDIMDKVCDIDFIAPEVLDNLFLNDFAEMERRDELVDVRITDFLKKWAKKEILFYSVNHPKNIVFNELVKRLLVYLGYYSSVEEVEFKNEKILDEEKTLKISCEAIYPSVCKYIYGELKEIEFNMPGTLKFDECIDFTTYVKYYVACIWNYKK